MAIQASPPTNRLNVMMASIIKVIQRSAPSAPQLTTKSPSESTIAAKTKNSSRQ